MGVVRRAAVAGQFYQNDAVNLRSTIEAYLADVSTGFSGIPKALIAPHAGFVYSGPIAASAYATLQTIRNKINRVVLLGPCHRVAVQGLALSEADAFETPLGEIQTDIDAISQIIDLPQVQVFEATHTREHSLEVQLPFLQVMLDDFKLVPLVVGQSTPEDVAEILDILWGDEETLVVISSDLSHYLEYQNACDLDHKTCQAIENKDLLSIDKNGACGRYPIGGLLKIAKYRGMSVTTLDVRNSGDTAGPKDRVVGYGSWVFTEPEKVNAEPDVVIAEPVEANAEPELVPAEPDAASQDAQRQASPIRRAKITLKPLTKPTPPTPRSTASIKLTAAPKPAVQVIAETLTTNVDAPKSPSFDEATFEEATRQLLVEHGANLTLLAALSIDHGLSNNKAFTITPEDHPEILRENGACFVTLKKNGELRGCIGTPKAYRSLVDDIVKNAYQAAFADPRFPKLTSEERNEIEISLSILSPQNKMTFKDEDELMAQLRPGTDGLIIEDGNMRALFLPSVWSQLPNHNAFLNRLKTKAGMPPNYWSNNMRAWRFIAAETS